MCMRGTNIVRLSESGTWPCGYGLRRSVLPYLARLSPI